MNLVGNGSQLMNGNEIEVYASNNSGIYSSYVDISNMLDGDTVLIKFYVPMTNQGSWKLVETFPFSDLQGTDVCKIAPIDTQFGYRLTIQQIAGTPYKTFPWYISTL